MSRTADGSDRVGYLTDVEYTGNFYSVLAPAWLAYIAAINGYTPPRLDRPFTYCELGCGKGVTSLVLAATYPDGDFHACDLNAAHIEYAEQLRVAAGLHNVRFHPKSFAQVLEEGLPACDCIVLHGVYSWVPEAVRGQIRQLLQRHLKPGGLCMVSYNTMPGWAHLQPVRRMMQAYAEALPGDALHKARAAFSYMSFLADHGAAYFKTLPAAAEHLKLIAQDDIRYVAHEYLTPHGDPFYFSDVNAAMRSAGLSFAGNLSAADNYPELMVARQFHELLATAPNRLVLETHRDFIANTAFRHDLYAAAAPALRPDDLPLERLDGMTFCVRNLPERLPLRREEPPLRYDLSSQAEIVHIVHKLLRDSPASAWDIHRAAGLDSEKKSAFLIQQLVVAEHLLPCPPQRAAAGWLRLNSALVEAALRDRLLRVPLACTQTGTAISAEPVQAASIEAASRFEESEAAARYVLAQLRKHAHPVNRTEAAGTARAATDAEILEYAGASWRALHDPANADARWLRLMGVLQ